MENMRWHPVADSLPHYASEDVEIGGVTIPKNAPIQGFERIEKIAQKSFTQTYR